MRQKSTTIYGDLSVKGQLNVNGQIINVDMLSKSTKEIDNAEASRIKNEIARNKAEELRASAEQARETTFATFQEDKQHAFELSEQTRETTFTVAESSRNDNEMSRQAAEKQRIANEIARANAEALRVSAEKQRIDDFNNSQNYRETVFNSNEEARKNGEANRISSEEIRQKEESDRMNSEIIRVKSEANRVSNENTRIQNEKNRGDSEATRIQSESTRSDNEKNRINAENIRIQTESIRKENETNRISSEQDRVDNESSRVNAENTRIQNEKSRINAETERKDYFDNTVKSKVSEMNELNENIKKEYKVLSDNTNQASDMNTELVANINSAKKNIDDLNAKNTTLTETVKNAKTINLALSSTIDTANNLNTTLTNNVNEIKEVNSNIDSIKSSLKEGVDNATSINSTLTNNISNANTSNTTLNNSLDNAKKYISSLDSSKNIPQLRLDVDAIQEGLKANQSLVYEGTDLTCKNTLEGRTEELVIKGNIIKDGDTLKSVGEDEGNKISISSLEKVSLIPKEYFLNNNSSNVSGWSAFPDTLDLKDVVVKFKVNRFLGNDTSIKIWTGNDELDGVLGKEVIKNCQTVKRIAFFNWGDIVLGHGREQIIEYLTTGALELTVLPTQNNNNNNYRLCPNFNAKQSRKEIILPIQDGLKSLPNGVCDTIEQRDDGVYLVQRVQKVEYAEGDENNADYLTDKVNTYKPLDKEIEIKLDIKDLDLETFADITYIASDNAVKPTLSFKVPSNLAGIVQQNAKNVNELYKLIDEVIIPQLMNNATDIQLLKLK